MQAGRGKQSKWLQVCLTAGPSGVYGAVCLQRASTQQVFDSINLLHTAAWWITQHLQSLLPRIPPSVLIPLSLPSWVPVSACALMRRQEDDADPGAMPAARPLPELGRHYPAARSALGGMTNHKRRILLYCHESFPSFFSFLYTPHSFCYQTATNFLTNHPGFRNVLMLKPTLCLHRLPCRQSSHP